MKGRILKRLFQILEFIVGVMIFLVLMIIFASLNLEQSPILEGIRYKSQIIFLVCLPVFILLRGIKQKVQKQRFFNLKFILSLACFCAVSWVLFSVLVYFTQGKMIYNQQAMSTHKLKQIQGNYPDVEEVRIHTSDQIQLHGWFSKKSKEDKTPLVIYFGGASEEVSHLLNYSEAFGEYSVALVNYRGYGMSGGEPKEKHLYKDALDIYDYFAKKECIDQRQIIVMGRSLGTSIAIYLANHRFVKGVILVSPFDSISKGVAKDIFQLIPTSFIINQKFDSLSRVSAISVPVLCVIGGQDRTVSPNRSLKLIKRWGGESTVQIVPEANHNNIYCKNACWESIKLFLENLWYKHKNSAF